MHFYCILREGSCLPYTLFLRLNVFRKQTNKRTNSPLRFQVPLLRRGGFKWGRWAFTLWNVECMYNQMCSWQLDWSYLHVQCRRRCLDSLKQWLVFSLSLSEKPSSEQTVHYMAQTLFWTLSAPPINSESPRIFRIVIFWEYFVVPIALVVIYIARNPTQLLSVWSTSFLITHRWGTMPKQTTAMYFPPVWTLSSFFRLFVSIAVNCYVICVYDGHQFGEWRLDDE